jgi:beta-barrel assembly-enhancing protease
MSVAMADVSATYFDGETARNNAVVLRRVGETIEFGGADVALTQWPIKGLHPIDMPATGQPFRLTHDQKPGARLVLHDQAFIDDLLAANHFLKGGYGWGHIRQVLGWTVGGIAVLAALGYLTLSFLPQQVARIMPDSWRNRMGDQIVKDLISGAKRCDNKPGLEATSAMVQALAEGQPDLPPISVEVYDIPVMNAFAAPGGRIIFTRELLKVADNAEEVTGVLAHEIGHVNYRHPEAQLVRIAGLQVLVSAMTGSNGGNISSNAAGLAALLQYSRDAETEADAYARDTMEKSRINPMGFKTFFEKILKLEKGETPSADTKSNDNSVFSKLGKAFSTHPGTEDRIKLIKPLPDGTTPVRVMTEQQFQDLKGICG